MTVLAVGCQGDGIVLTGPDGAPRDASEVADAPEPIDASPVDARIPSDARIVVQATAVAMASNTIYSLWADADAVYWATVSDVVRWDRAGEATVTLSSAEGVPLSLVGDGTWLYWTVASGIRRSPDGAAAAQDLIVGQPAAYHLAVDGDELFWSDYTGEIHSAPLAGGSPATLVAGLGATTGIALTTDNVYFTEIGATPQAVRRISKSPPGSPIIPITAGSQLSPGIITGDQDTVFWVQDDTLYRYYEGVGGLVEPLVHESFPISGTTIVGDRVFWIVDGGGTGGSARLRGMPVRGGAVDAETYADDFSVGAYTEIRPGGGILYWFSGPHVWSARYRPPD